MQADGENLPFEDNEFDYVICCHVLEHVDDPIRFMREQCRVAKRGYLETPNLMGEHLAPKESHRWLLLEVNEKIVAFEKEKLGFNTSNDFGDIFLEYLPQNSIGFKILQRTHADIMTLRYEWADEIEVVVNPMEDEEMVTLFTTPWRSEVYQQFLPQRSLGQEALAAAGALGEVMRSVVKSKLLSKVGLG
jgi:ubiquinone/menaquinone biosynthesis C-methylase UbiE